MILTLKHYLYIAFFAIFTLIYIDYFAINHFGKYISLSIMLVILLILLCDYKKGIFGFIFLSLVIPQFSRSLILEVVESDNLDVSGFYSFHSTTLLGFALPILFIIIAGTIALFHIIRSNDKIIKISFTEPWTWFFFIIIFLTITTLINVFDGRLNEIRSIVSDLRLVVIWMFGVFIYKYVYLITTEEERFKLLSFTLLMSVLVVGTRTAFFVVLDMVNNIKSYDFATQPYVSYPFIFSLIYVFNKSKLKSFFIMLAALAAFSLKRSDLAFVVILLVIYFILGLVSKKKEYQHASFKSILYFSGVLILISYGLFFFVPDAFSFLVYKLNFFTSEMWQGELSNSALVRKLEFDNIYIDALNRTYPIFIGSGLGGYFDFSHTYMPSFIGVSDFSSAEIASNRFTRPHTFFNYIGLKGGFIYLSFYLLLIFFLLIKGFEAVRINNYKNNATNTEINMVLFFSIGYAVFCLNMFWQPIHSFLFVFILSLILDYTKENKHGINSC